jgi:hypothetical protein
MSDVLDEKLDRALDKLIEGGQFVGSKEFLIYITERFDPEHDKSPMQARKRLAHAAIRQAFIDAGWVHVSASQETQAAIAYTMLGNRVMTGQEWYDRFDDEVTKEVLLPPWKVFEAARRAAGLSKGE